MPGSGSAVRSFVVATTTFISGQDDDDGKVGVASDAPLVLYFIYIPEI